MLPQNIRVAGGGAATGEAMAFWGVGWPGSGSRGQRCSCWLHCSLCSQIWLLSAVEQLVTWKTLRRGLCNQPDPNLNVTSVPAV